MGLSSSVGAGCSTMRGQQQRELSSYSQHSLMDAISAYLPLRWADNIGQSLMPGQELLKIIQFELDPDTNPVHFIFSFLFCMLEGFMCIIWILFCASCPNSLGKMGSHIIKISLSLSYLWTRDDIIKNIRSS